MSGTNSGPSGSSREVSTESTSQTPRKLSAGRAEERRPSGERWRAAYRPAHAQATACQQPARLTWEHEVGGAPAQPLPCTVHGLWQLAGVGGSAGGGHRARHGGGKQCPARQPCVMGLGLLPAGMLLQLLLWLLL